MLVTARQEHQEEGALGKGRDNNKGLVSRSRHRRVTLTTLLRSMLSVLWLVVPPFV